jgi:hypothetical protein
MPFMSALYFIILYIIIQIHFFHENRCANIATYFYIDLITISSSFDTKACV